MSTVNRPLDHPEIPVVDDDMPIMYEDEGQDDMGEANEHSDVDFILTIGLRAHLAGRPELRIFTNLNTYYHPTKRKAYISPDVMVVQPTRPLLVRIPSYRIGRDGPPPLLALEILSERSHQQRDLTDKPRIYARLGVPEYILIDPSGEFMAQRLVLRRLTAKGTWKDEQDKGQGVTSKLGFRLIIEEDGLPRLINAATSYRYRRPEEAESAERRAQRAEEQARLSEEQTLLAEKQTRLAEEQARMAEEQTQLAEKQNLLAEKQARLASEKAAEQIRRLEAELARLRRPPESQS